MLRTILFERESVLGVEYPDRTVRIRHDEVGKEVLALSVRILVDEREELLGLHSVAIPPEDARILLKVVLDEESLPLREFGRVHGFDDRFSRGHSDRILRKCRHDGNLPVSGDDGVFLLDLGATDGQVYFLRLREHVHEEPLVGEDEALEVVSGVSTPEYMVFERDVESLDDRLVGAGDIGELGSYLLATEDIEGEFHQLFFGLRLDGGVRVDRLARMGIYVHENSPVGNEMVADGHIVRFDSFLREFSEIRPHDRIAVGSDMREKGIREDTVEGKSEIIVLIALQVLTREGYVLVGFLPSREFVLDKVLRHLVDTNFRAFEVGVDVGDIEDSLVVVALLGHTEYPPDGLYLEDHRSDLPKHHEDLCTRTVPSCRDRLLEDKHFWYRIILIDAVEILLLVREPYGEFLVRDANIEIPIQYPFGAFQFRLVEFARRLGLARELDEDERSDGRPDLLVFFP